LLQAVLLLKNLVVAAKAWLGIKTNFCMTSNRDLLVMFRQRSMTQQDIDREVMQLNNLLFTTERLDNFVAAHEVLDLNKYKIVKKAVEIKKMIRQKKLSKPFVFFSNKN
jgi:hypothetical protein